MSDFNLNAEIKCDFYISSERKKVWAYELELLQIFIDICEKNNLKYWAISGTLLGAVRHDGFIPWDDDMDLAMPRDDYEKFIEVAQAMLKPPFFLQTNESDPLYLHGNIRLRNLDTTAIIKHEAKKNIRYKQGIWISIFPYDAAPDNSLLFKIHRFEIVALKHMTRAAMYKEYSTLKNPISKLVLALCKGIVRMVGKNNMYAIEKHFVTKYDNRKTERIGQISAFYEWGDRCLYKRRWIETLIPHQFENLTLMIPSEYDSYLDKKYGNWHEFVKGASTHGDVFFDTERPYTYYHDKYDNLMELFENYSL